MAVLHNISELATCPPSNLQADAGIIRDAALVIQDGRVAWAGISKSIPEVYRAEPRIDCQGGLVIPGLVDCHTHLCFGGWRNEEFELRIGGTDYREIARRGGGILSTVRATRATGIEELVRMAGGHLKSMAALGITTVECKSGYGLDAAHEVKQLEVYRHLSQCQDIRLVPTFLGAHTVPPEYAGRSKAYVDVICERMLPEIAERGLAAFCDVFVEAGAFTVVEAREILLHARALGLGAKVHADQLSDGGGALLAAEVGAVSAEHLEYVSDAGIQALAASGTVAVSLPLASLYLKERYLPARRLLGAGVPVAVATDFNPGSAPSFHLPLALLLACIYQSMTPAEALMGATTVAAKALGLGHEIGSLVEGFSADLAILDAPTLSQWIYHFQPNACIGTAKAGRWIFRRGALDPDFAVARGTPG